MINWIANIYEAKDGKIHAEVYSGGKEEADDEADLWISNGARVLAKYVPSASPTLDEDLLERRNDL